MIPERIAAFMEDCEKELFALGIPVKTRHNEVAPSQYEFAPVFESANLAADHQQLMMITMRKMAQRHGLECLLHEKPFAGVNGSGKHVNFSFGNSTQGNLLFPGDTPHENAQFLVFCTAVIRAVHLHGDLLRAVVASASNDHRLGANEAPPAIISVFLGEQLTDVFEQIKVGGAKSSRTGGTLGIGVDTLPKLPKDAGDRNRTSPFAFTGNRFEFRAVGSGQPINDSLTTLNAIIAESIDYMATKLEAATAGGKSLNSAVQTLLTEVTREHSAIVYNGNGYTEEWHAEAAKRGLPNLKTSIEALPVFEKPEVVKLFDKYGILTPRELKSRFEVSLEQYIKTVQVEEKLVTHIATAAVLPGRAPIPEGTHRRHRLGQGGRPVAEHDARNRGLAPCRRSGEGNRRAQGGGVALRHGHCRRGQAPVHGGPAGHGHRPNGRRRSRGSGRGRPVAASDVSGDAVHPLIFVRGRGVRAASDPACRAVGALQAGHGSTAQGRSSVA